MKKVIFAFILFLVPITLEAATIYVDGNIGPPSCVGTYDVDKRTCLTGGVNTAYKTGQLGANAMSAGDTLLIRAGTYDTGAGHNIQIAATGSASARYTIRNFPTETVTLKANSVEGGGNGPFTLRISGSYITFQGDDPTRFIIDGGEYAIYMDGTSTATNNELLNLTVTRGYRQGIALRYTVNNTRIAGNIVYDNVRSNWPRGTDPAWGAGISLVRGGANANNIVENNYIYWNHGEGLSIAIGGNGNILRNNVVSDNWSVNLYNDGAGLNNTYDNNLVWNTNDANFWPCVPGGCTNGDWSYSLGLSAGIETDSPGGSIAGTRFTRNIIINTNGGIRTFRAPGQNQPITGLTLDNNTIINSSACILLVNNGTAISDITVANNICIQDGGLNPSGVLQVWPIPTNSVYKNNLWYTNLSAAIYINNGGNSYASGASTLGFTNSIGPSVNPLVTSYSTVPGRLWGNVTDPLGGNYGAPTATVASINALRASTTYSLQPTSPISPAIDVGTATITGSIVIPSCGSSPGCFYGAAPDMGAKESGVIVAPSCPATNLLVAQYSFDGVASDSSGQGNNATLGSGVTYVTGKYNQGISTTGAVAAATVPHTSSLYLCNFTLMGWVQLSAPLTGFAGLVTNNYSPQDGWYIYAGSSGYGAAGAPIGGYQVGATAVAAVGNTLTTAMTHVAITYDRALGSANLKLYVNGTNVSSANGTAVFNDWTGNMVIGADPFGSYLPKGTIVDEVRIYNYPRTGAEITTDMNTPINPVSPPPTPVIVKLSAVTQKIAGGVTEKIGAAP
jgi:parallel beta-helix repeat protein